MDDRVKCNDICESGLRNLAERDVTKTGTNANINAAPIECCECIFQPYAKLPYNLGRIFELLLIFVLREVFIFHASPKVSNMPSAI